MWVLKFSGKTYYINHITSEGMSWSTKETENNPHTKGSLKFKKCYVGIDDNNEAIIRPLTEIDEARIRAKDRGHTRILFMGKKYNEVMNFFKDHGIKHTPIKTVRYACSDDKHICDLVNKKEAVYALLAIGGAGGMIRELNENEIYWKFYDDKKLLEKYEKGLIDENGNEFDDDD